jgi:hypothetical protein
MEGKSAKANLDQLRAQKLKAANRVEAETK